MRSLKLLVVLAALGACEKAEDQSNLSAAAPAAEAPAVNSQAPETVAEPAAAWDLQASGEGTALALASSSGVAAVRLFCPAGNGQLVVNVAGFRPVGSEERLSFGSGSQAVTLVADSRGDAQRGGVSGTGALPENLAALLGGPVSVNYGSQGSGPHAAPSKELSSAFVAACREGAAAAKNSEDPAKKDEPVVSAAASPCLMQGATRLQVKSLQATGTEPFWSARIEGRCVVYSHPEDQKGTRVWTRYTQGPNGGGIWTGDLGGKKFELRTRRQAGCSDGMSDRKYPIAVELVVQGEQRKGCASLL